MGGVVLILVLLVAGAGLIEGTALPAVVPVAVIGLGVALLAGFVVVERRGRAPLIAWRELTDARDDLEPDLRGWFAAEPDRARRLSLDAGDLHVDLSKNLVDDRILAELVRMIEGGEPATADVELHADLVIRRSAGPPPKVHKLNRSVRLIT